jgi:hypothetical protein
MSDVHYFFSNRHLQSVVTRCVNASARVSSFFFSWSKSSRKEKGKGIFVRINLGVVKNFRIITKGNVSQKQVPALLSCGIEILPFQ